MYSPTYVIYCMKGAEKPPYATSHAPMNLITFFFSFLEPLSSFFLWISVRIIDRIREQLGLDIFDISVGSPCTKITVESQTIVL